MEYWESNEKKNRMVTVKTGCAGRRRKGALPIDLEEKETVEENFESRGGPPR